VETRRSGSEGGPGRRTELKSRHCALVRPYDTGQLSVDGRGEAILCLAPT